MVYALAAQVSTGGCYVGSLLKKVGDYTNDRCLMSGTFANSNSFGCFAGMALAASIALVPQERSRRRALEVDDDGSSPAEQFLRKMGGGVPIYLGSRCCSSAHSSSPPRERPSPSPCRSSSVCCSCRCAAAGARAPMFAAR